MVVGAMLSHQQSCVWWESQCNETLINDLVDKFFDWSYKKVNFQSPLPCVTIHFYVRSGPEGCPFGYM